jgi:GntR family transcriptional regulator/MocR family aminotransferase
MSKVVSSFELSLNEPLQNQTLSKWFYSELRAAILEGRLKAGAKLPSSRDFCSPVPHFTRNGSQRIRATA